MSTIFNSHSPEALFIYMVSFLGEDTLLNLRKINHAYKAKISSPLFWKQITKTHYDLIDDSKNWRKTYIWFQGNERLLRIKIPKKRELDAMQGTKMHYKITKILKNYPYAKENGSA